MDRVGKGAKELDWIKSFVGKNKLYQRKQYDTLFTYDSVTGNMSYLEKGAEKYWTK